MSMTVMSNAMLRRLGSVALLATAGLLVAVLCDAAQAQTPFGSAGAAAAAPHLSGGPAGWLMAKQAAYYREFTGLIRAAKADGSAVYGLLGLSFTYGILHAAGPGHGKAVISSYLIANGESWRRGVALSFASALLQAFAAVTIVGIAAILLGGTAKMMGDTLRVIEIASYLLVIAVGLRLTWIKTRSFRAVLQTINQHSPALAHVHVHDHGHVPAPPRGPVHHHDGPGDHAACASCGHAHGPAPRDLGGPGGWGRGVSAIFAAGLRPCSGAILVLVFALAQGLFWAGVASALAMGLGTAITVAALATLAVGARSAAGRLAAGKQGYGLLVLRGLEAGAALAVVAAGLLLLTGYMANERMFGG
jgi:nickel/cobalt exporter